MTMQSHDEVELKWMLTPSAHQICADRISQTLGPPRILNQENRFYDTNDGHLLRAQVNLRLRCENGSWIVTCKQRVHAADGLHHHQEWEQALDITGDDPLPDALRAPLPSVVRDALAGQTPRCLGGFTNQRLAWEEQGDHLCLDTTTFQHRTDHELEVETRDPERCRQQWDLRFSTWEIEAQPSLTTKFARFRETIQRES
jgi:uncharacterized protein YjbK